MTSVEGPKIVFPCPHCGTRLQAVADTRVTVQDGDPTVDIRTQHAVCPRCAKAMRLTICALVEKLSDHDVRKDMELFRLTEAVMDAREETLVCRSCGGKFRWTEKDEREREEKGPEGEDPRTLCLGCRVKQDGQRA